MKAEDLTRITANRRNFLKGAGLAGIGVASATMIGAAFSGSEQKVEAAAYSDVDILNFALNLEYLEAEFYLKSTWNTSLVQIGVLKPSDTTGPTKGGQMVPGFGKMAQAYLASGLRRDEVNHVIDLRSALGSNAVKKPEINLDALGYGFGQVDGWLKLARQLEDVGVSAYLGAAPLISNNNYLAAAAAILAAEAQHSGSLRAVCIMNGVGSPAVDSMDIPPDQGHPYNVNAKTGMSIPRTPAQVLNIVYAKGGCSGGFFPFGMNGGIVCQNQ